MLQGARHAHVQALNSAANELNIPLQIFELRKDNDLFEANPDAIILPGEYGYCVPINSSA